ncbi:hypothetical protein HA402_013521 [Bradysia odoriphaga]|nr:hypothetical protein HA402_013521 [Bradysia odoriphaga]
MELLLKKIAEILQLTDFGMVCNFKDKPPLSSYISTRWYRAPEVMLTYGYYGPPVDIWALGCIFYEILTLKPLFPGENQTDQLNKIHSVLGSPSKDVLRRLKHLDTSIAFQTKKGTGLHSLAILSGDGMDIWRKMLEYRADLRINAFQMFEHSYFDSLRSSKSKSMILHEDRILAKAKSNICLSRKLEASETKMKERLWGMNSDEPSINKLLPALESLQIDRSKSRTSSICSNDDSICSLEIVEPGAYQITSDELPIFSISSMSPTSRSLSPVMADQMCISPVDFSDFDDDDEECSDDLSTDNPDRMLLNDIHALIGTPDEKNDRRLLNLETIFEDVFLETPPKRKQMTPQQYERKRYSFESISRYVKDQQKFEYCSEDYEAFSVSSECTNMEQNKPDL